jgi:hypothetical protein
VPSRYAGGSSPGSHVARSAMARSVKRARGEWAWFPSTVAVLLLKSVGGLEEKVQVWTSLPRVLAANAMAAAAGRTVQTARVFFVADVLFGGVWVCLGQIKTVDMELEAFRHRSFSGSGVSAALFFCLWHVARPKRN